MSSPNSAYVARDLAHVWHPCTQMKDHEQLLPLIPIRRGRGAWLEDYSGQRYLDAISSWWVNLFGHANARTTQRYAHLASDTLTDATEIVDGIVTTAPRMVTPEGPAQVANW